MADHHRDVNGDGDLDYVLHFRTRDASIPDDAIEACLTGETTDGSQDVDGSDVIRLAERFGTEEGAPPPVGLQPYGRRIEVYPTGASVSKIESSDVIALETYFGQSCP